MSERDYAPLSIACVRGLCDKIYEKRKFAGVEIEKMVKDFSDANNTSQIKRLIRVLGQDLMTSTNPNVKNGALMGLSSVAVGLGQGCVEHLGELLPPVLACLGESESRVRYQAAEALFNVGKIARGAALPHFPAVFDALARLAADPEPQVRHAAELTDRLFKDIVTESGCVETGACVALVRERVYARGAAARQFVLSWLAVLDAVPAVDLRPHLPDLLDGLFHMLDDPDPEIRRMCEVQLSEFLRSIKKEPARADLPAMTNILIAHAQAPEDLVQLTAISWVREFVRLDGARMLPFAAGILCAVLPCLAYTTEPRKNIREAASAVNTMLLALVPGEGEGGGEGGGAGGEGEGGAGLDVGGAVGVLAPLLQLPAVAARAAALDWILHLYNKMPQQMLRETERVWGGVAGALADPADDVVRRALAVLAEVCSASALDGELESSPYYHKFLRALLRLLAADPALLEDRAAFIIRQVCVLLSAEAVYGALARLVRAEGEAAPRLAAAVVDVLATILLTAAELFDLRARLRAFDTPATHALFKELYLCWCHSGASLLALCLLTHNYQHCASLVAAFGEVEVTVEVLTELDKLVQLLESPIFAYLRLELVGGSAGGGALRAALYGLLMLLPQSDAFHTLRRRLQCAPADVAPVAVSPAAPAPAPDIDFDALLAEFRRVQAAHRRHKTLGRAPPPHAS